MNIAGYLKTSLIEWPGKIASVIFVSGCNFRCPFCHNANLVLGRGFSRMPEERILADLASRKKWIEAVVVTGGEPTLQTDLSRFISRLKQMGFLVMVHTNGTRPKVINGLIVKKLTDYIAMDIKGDLENYEKYTNVQCKMYNVQKSIKLIAGSGIDYEFRTTVVPGLHNVENLTNLARQVKEEIENCKLKIVNCRWYLQQYRPLNTLDKRYLKIKPYSKEKMEKFCRQLQKIIPQTRLRGV